MINTDDSSPSDLAQTARKAAVDGLVGSRLRLCREALGWTTEDMAEVLGCDAALLCAYETGEIRVSPVDLTEIARTFQIPVVWFFVGLARPDGARPENQVDKARAAMLEADEERVAGERLAVFADELARIRDPSLRIMLIDMARGLARHFG
jgi:transcriptional regulator with XRE-family HTH domain